MKAVDILAEVGKEKGIESLELVIAQAIEAMEALAPRLAAEADEQAAKVIGSGMMIALPAFKVVLEKLADLNKDGKIG